MIITNELLLSEIFSLDNMPHNEEDLKYWNSAVEYIDLNSNILCEYLNRNVRQLNINLSKISNDEYEQLYELLKRCKKIDVIRFSSIAKETKINNNLVNLLINSNIKSVIFARNTVVDCNNLINNLDQVSEGCVIRLASLDNKELERSYLNLPSNIQRKLIGINFSDELYDKIYDCQKMKKVDLELYFNYRDFFDNLNEFTISINNVGELTNEKLNILKSDSRITGIFIKCGFQEEESIYTLDEYENILKEIHDIISNIKMPSNDDPNKEKIIFAQLYSLIGKRIIYDDYAITDEGKKDKKLSVDCRNLRNGLLGVTREGKEVYTCVCAGYATILQNVCSLVGIKCDYIRSNSKEVEEENVCHIDPYDRVYENGTSDPMGHAYNSVELDGQAYFCDITWDSDMIRANGTTENFLKSYDDFYYSHHDVGFSYNNVEVISLNNEKKLELDKQKYFKSISLEEQRQLFLIPQLDEMINIGYLGGFVEHYIHFVKECKSKVEINDIYNIVNMVSALEEYILSDEFRNRVNMTDNALAIPVVIKTENGDKTQNIVFYNSSVDTFEETIDSVERMVKHGR